MATMWWMPISRKSTATRSPPRPPSPDHQKTRRNDPAGFFHESNQSGLFAWRSDKPRANQHAGLPPFLTRHDQFLATTWRQDLQVEIGWHIPKIRQLQLCARRRQVSNHDVDRAVTKVQQYPPTTQSAPAGRGASLTGRGGFGRGGIMCHAAAATTQCEVRPPPSCVKSGV